MCTFRVAKMVARSLFPYIFSRLSEQWPAVRSLLANIVLEIPALSGEGCLMTMQSATYRDGLSQEFEPAQEPQVQTEQPCRIVLWRQTDRQSTQERGAEKPRGEWMVLSCSPCPPWHIVPGAWHLASGTHQALGRVLPHGWHELCWEISREVS